MPEEVKKSFKINTMTVFNLDKLDPNLDTLFLVEDEYLNAEIDKWIQEIDPETNTIKWTEQKGKKRSETKALRMLARLLLHTDSDSRTGMVSRSLPVVSRLFGSHVIANLLILLENSRQNEELIGLTPEELWKTLLNNKQFNYGNTLLTGLKIEVDAADLVKSITYRDFRQPKGHTTEKSTIDNFSPLLKKQFLQLFFAALEECGYFDKDGKGLYPYFMPALVLQGYVIKAELGEDYQKVIDNYLKLQNKKPDSPRPSSPTGELKGFVGKMRLKDSDTIISRDLTEQEVNNLIIWLGVDKGHEAQFKQDCKDKSPKVVSEIRLKIKEAEDLKQKASEPVNLDSAILKEIEYTLFGVNNFFALKQKIESLVDQNQAFLHKGYVLKMFATKGIETKSQISTFYSTANGNTPSFTNCAETGICNFYGVYLPFDQMTGDLNPKVTSNEKLIKYLKEASKNISLKDFTEQFLVNQPWLPYRNFRYKKDGNFINSEIKGYPLYIKLPVSSYEFVKTELSKLNLIIEEKPAETPVDCFQASDKDPTKPVLGHNLMFIKDSDQVMVYEIKSGLMGFHLFNEMLYRKSDSAKADVDKFLSIITKSSIVPDNFTADMKKYDLVVEINSIFNNRPSAEAVNSV